MQLVPAARSATGQSVSVLALYTDNHVHWELLLPSEDEDEPDVSIVIPAMNEGLTVATTVEWCLEGLRSSGVRGEVLIVDSSSDDTPEIARAAGARVLLVRTRGLGLAYREAIPVVRGKFVIMGDADCTYDFRQLGVFVQAWRDGAEFVMGSRWKGTIQEGAMPALHRYFGTPVTTSFLNAIYRTHFSDIHCGMRGITTEALRRIDLKSDSWQYASEMIIRAVRLGLVTAEVPVSFLADPPGRESHLKRIGWWAPWHAGWLTVRALLSYGVDYALVVPGAIIASIALIFAMVLVGGPVTLGPLLLTLNWMFLMVILFSIGLQLLLAGLSGRLVLSPPTKWGQARWLADFDRVSLLAGVLLVSGAALAVPLLVQWVQQGFRLSPSSVPVNHLALFGLLLVLAASQIFGAALVVQSFVVSGRARSNE